MTAHPIPPAALEAHLAILGKTGAGKSYAARSTVEGVLARGERACIVDPTGVWWGLRLDARGKPDGFPAVIAGGRHGDVPLAGEEGAALARIAGGSATPLILDTSGLSTAARTRLFTAFAEALLIENVGPLHVVVDEAHLFAPQSRVPDPQSALMVHAANGLVALGRARGLRVMLLSQRPAKLHKDALTQVETLVAMRFTAPQDRKAVEAWIVDQADRKRGAEIVASLPTLKQGEGWVWSPDAEILERAAFPAIATFDSMRPEAQGGRALAPIDVAAIRAALTSFSTSDGAAKKGTAPPPTADEIAAAERQGYAAGEAAGRAGQHREISGGIAALADEFEQLAMRLRGLLDVAAPTARITVSLPDETGPAGSAPGQRRVRPTLATEAAPGGRETGSAPAALTPARQRVLDRLAWFRALGLEPVARVRVCVMVGLSPKASTFGVYVSELVRDGLVETIAPGMLRLTPAGSARAAEPDVGVGPEALVRAASEQLDPQPRRLFDLIAGAYPDPVRRDDLADAMGLSRTASTLGVYVSDLSSRGFVEVAGRGLLRAASFLFPNRRTS